VHSDVDAIAALVKENQKFADLMYNPIVESDKKKAVIQEIAKGAGFQKYTTNFLKLLVEKDRVNLLNEICESFEEQYCQLTDTQVCRRALGPDHLGQHAAAVAKQQCILQWARLQGAASEMVNQQWDTPQCAQSGN
jgi:hypothetical protein